QDQSNGSFITSSYVRFTTAELTDSLRRSSSQPTPLPVRGNAARRISLSQQASQSQSHARSPARSPARSHKHQSGSQSKSPSTSQSQSQSQSQSRSQWQRSPQYDTQEHPHSRISQLFQQLSNVSETSYISTSSQATSSQASTSQMSSPVSQNGDGPSSQKNSSKKYRHRKKKRPLPVTSPLHGKNSSQNTVHVAGTPSGPSHIAAPPAPTPASASAPMSSMALQSEKTRKTGGTKVAHPQKSPSGDVESESEEEHGDNGTYSLVLDYDNSSSNDNQENNSERVEKRHEPAIAKATVSTIELEVPIPQKKTGDKAKDRDQRQVLADVTAAMTQSQHPTHSEQPAPTIESSDPRQHTQSLEITTHSQIEPGQRIPSSYSFEKATTESQEFDVGFDYDFDEDDQGFQEDFNHPTESPDAVSQERRSSLVPVIEIPLPSKSSAQPGAKDISQGIRPVRREIKEVLDFIEIRSLASSPKPPSHALNKSKDRMELSPKARSHKRRAQQEFGDFNDESVDYDSSSSREASPVLTHARTARRNARSVLSEELVEPRIELMDSPSKRTRRTLKPVEAQVTPRDLSPMFTRASSKSAEPHIALLDSPSSRTRASFRPAENEDLLSKKMSGIHTQRARAPVSYKEFSERIKDDDSGSEMDDRRMGRTTPTPNPTPKPMAATNPKQPDFFATDVEYGVDVGRLFGDAGTEITKQKQGANRTKGIERDVQAMSSKRLRKRIVLSSSDFEPSPSVSPAPLQESSPRAPSPRAPSLERSASPRPRPPLSLSLSPSSSSPSKARPLADANYANHINHTNDINQNDDVESEDEWEVKRLKQLWEKHNIQWPLRDRTLENKGFREPYSLNFVFGTALPLPRSRG
ncbi:hypothetical protein BGZ51_003016, partial [Haplosporangium sp. Z 767]